MAGGQRYGVVIPGAGAGAGRAETASPNALASPPGAMAAANPAGRSAA